MHRHQASASSGGPALRVVSWNMHMRVGEAAARQAALLRELRPDLACLQEVNANAAEILKTDAGFTWTTDIQPSVGQGRVRRSAYLAVLAGSDRTTGKELPRFNVLFPERIVSAKVTIGRTDIAAISYHAPPGVNWGIEKVRQALALSDWLSTRNEPAILGADANTPEVDAIEFDQTRTHWHTGHRRLKGGRGDDVLWSQAKVHPLRDVLRVWLDEHPAELEEIRRLRPAGPLRVSHFTGVRRGQEGTPRRFDSIWVTDDFAVRQVRYLYDEAITAGSDHAVVVADLSVYDSTRSSGEM